MNLTIEQLATKLAALYKSYGFESYAMSKFEEYELYLRNKDFLISDRVLTFTDTDGKLMALKPDVTLSIIKNTRDTKSVQKLFYRENVYRPGKNDQGFREIMQVGLECMGNIDNYSILEVLLLAVKSLKTVSDQCVLDVSHMGLLSAVLVKCSVGDDIKDLVLQAIGSKNAHEIRSLCENTGADPEPLCQLAKLSGPSDAVMPQLSRIFGEDPMFSQFQSLIAALEKTEAKDSINIDFSVVNDMRYYNGIAFRGFVKGVPDGVLAGGQYDTLMTKMGRRSKAIGFALYPDSLERMAMPADDTGICGVLVYEDSAELWTVAQAVKQMIEKGIAVKALPRSAYVPTDCPCYRLTEKGVEEVSENA